MYMTKYPAKDFKNVLPADYRKHNVYVSVFPERGKNINSYWGGGSKSVYQLVNLETGKHVSLPSSTHPFFEIERNGLANLSSPAIETDHVGNITLKILPENVALVETGYFCGKASTAHIFVNPNNLPKLLQP